MQKEVKVNTCDETINLGLKIGKLLKIGDVILLDGDLGSGKTTFTKGIGQALEVKKIINSPTFTIVKRYEGKYTLNHLDLYRLNGEFRDFDLEDIIYSDSISVIEWPFIVEELLPKDYLLINIKRIDDDKRLFTLTSVGDRFVKLVGDLDV